MTANKPRPPVRPRYGRVPGFGQRPRTEAGACPTCGAYPACDVRDSLADPDAEPCRSIHCPDAGWPHPYDSATCPKI